MHPFKKDGILEALADCAGIVLDSLREFSGGQVGMVESILQSFNKAYNLYFNLSSVYGNDL